MTVPEQMHYKTQRLRVQCFMKCVDVGNAAQHLYFRVGVIFGEARESVNCNTSPASSAPGIETY